VEVTAENNTLTVRAERRWDPEQDDVLIAQERTQGSFARQLLLGEELDKERIDAAYEDGVLTLTVPVASAAKPRKIEVRAPGSAHADAISVEAEGSASKK
jgi:HSP20 family protein